MGANDGDSDESPIHEVAVAEFRMDLTEVTVAAYRACVDAKKCSAPDTFHAACNWGRAGQDRHPVNCVTWDQAREFCNWAGKSLPTEAQWEYAARGTDGRTYPWGNDEPTNRACWLRREWRGTCEVGSFSPGDSPFGVKDMAGNVFEWTESHYSENYSKPRDVDARVIRGGTWGDLTRDI